MASRTIDEIYQLMQFVIRKQLGSFVTIPEATEALRAAQLDRFEFDFKQYQINQVVVDALSPFKVRTQFTSASDGEVTVPANYQHLIGGVFTVTGSTVNTVRFINDDELGDALTNQLRPVSTSRPIAVDSANGFQLYPQSQQTGFYSYLRIPNTPVYAYTQVGRVITYDAANSVQLEYYDVYIDNIIARALSYLGVNLDERGVQEFAQLQEQQTN